MSAFDSEVLDVQLFEGGTNKSWLPFINMQDKNEPAADPAAEKKAASDTESAEKKKAREAAVAEILKNKEAAEARAAEAEAAFSPDSPKTVGTMQTNIKENERRL